jgi:hypothetical protein
VTLHFVIDEMADVALATAENLPTNLIGFGYPGWFNFPNKPSLLHRKKNLL